MALITFDGLELPNGDISESFENIENIQKSEAGTDIGTVTRLLKLTLNVSIKCNGIQYKEIQKKARLPFGTLLYKGETKTARLRVSGSPYEKYSEQIEGIGGLWTVSLSIVEI